jgi:hypothetical protein
MASSSSETSRQGLGTNDLPALFRIADENANRAQHRFTRATGLRLVMLVTAALTGALSWKRPGVIVDGFAIAAAAAFIVALLSEAYLFMERPERTWYESRAAAETSKTLAWRYAVGGRPFAINQASSADTDRLFIEQLREVLDGLKEIRLTPIQGGEQQITNRMRETRARPLGYRKVLYEEGRVRDQQRWYGIKAAYHERRARGFAVAMIVAEAAGAIGAILRATGVVKIIDPRTLAASLATAFAAWTQTRRHDTLAKAYMVAHLDLSSIHEILPLQGTEEAWAEFVSTAEAAISREHTMWRASRGFRG